MVAQDYGTIVRQLLTMLGLLVNRIENHFSQLTPTLWRALAYCAQLRLFL